MKIRIDEALAKAKYNGKAVLKKDLAAKLWPDSSEISQQVNLSNLCAGRTTKISPEWILILCSELGVSADYLFGLSNE